MTGRGWAAFVAVAVLWGVPYVLIKVGVDGGLSPGFIAWARVAVGAAALLAVVPWSQVLRLLRHSFGWLLAYALMEVALPFPLVAIGEQYIASSTAAVLVAAAPVWALVVAPLVEGYRLGWRSFGGAVVGMAGVGVATGVDVAGRPGELYGAAAVLLAALCYAIGPFVIARAFSGVDPLISTAAALLLATVLLAPAAVAAPPTAITAPDVAVLLLLGLLCTAVAMACYTVVISEAGTHHALVVSYLNPLVAIVSGAVILGERPDAGLIVGLPLIVLGSWLSLRRPTALRAGAGREFAGPATAPDTSPPMDPVDVVTPSSRHR